MELALIILIFCTHWVADFVFQDEKWALGKSKNNIDLLSHTGTYTLVWLVALPVLGWNIIPFLMITMTAHTATDYITSRIVSKRFADGHLGSPIPNFGAFSVIGFDQVLHYIQLFLTFSLCL